MARRGENIYQRKDKRWEARVIIGRKQDGRAKYKYLYGHSYCEVKEKKKEYIIEIEKNDPIEPPKAGTVAYVSKIWLREIAASLKESSVCRYREKLDTYILPEFGMRELSDISTDEIAAFIALLQTDGYKGRKPIGSSSASMVLTVFKQLRLHALRSDLKVRFSPECIRIRSHKPTVEAFSEEEETSLIKHLKDGMGNTEAGVLTMLFTGIRIGELCALNCDNIDLDAGVIHINQTMQRLPLADGGKKTSVRINSPKSDSSIRDIPINKELTELLRGICQPGAFLLTGKKEKYVEPRTFENRFNVILKDCGIKKVGVHSCRHTFASRCIERGVDAKTLSEILGHSNVATTLNTYVHTTVKRKAESVEMIADLLAV